MTKYALEMVKYVPKMAKYADYAKMHKNTVSCRKMAKYANCIKNMHLHVFCSPTYDLLWFRRKSGEHDENTV